MNREKRGKRTSDPTHCKHCALSCMLASVYIVLTDVKATTSSLSVRTIATFAAFGLLALNALSFLTKHSVLRMDHHCPWTGGCIGFGNHRYFFLFLFWLITGCLYVILTTLSFLLANHDNHYVRFALMLCSSVGIGVGGLAAWHMYLILSGQTTIEFLNNRTMASEAKLRRETFVNVYHLGWRKNMQLFFGINSLWQFCLPNLNLPPGDGIAYPKVNSE